MKYDILEPFRQHLEENYNKNTAKKYYYSVKNLFEDIQFNNLQEIDQKFYEKELPKLFKTKNDFSAVKNGLLQLKKMYPKTNLPGEDFFKAVSRGKRNWSKKKKEPIYLDTMKRKINQIQNNKLKLAYRLGLISGLRVSEIAALEKKDITFKDGIITVHVRHGKGGSNGYVVCEKDAYLFKNLFDYMAQMEANHRVFYSAAYMQKKAWELGIENHDCRRVFAIQRRNRLKKEMNVFEANKATKESLRHTRFSTTKRYLYNKKLIIKE